MTVATALLTIERLSLQAGPRLLLDQLKLQVDVGQRWVVLGPNGAGKSTLLATLAGLRRESALPLTAAPLIQLAGRSLVDWPVQALAAQRAVVGDRWLDPFSATVLETAMTARYRFQLARQADTQAEQRVKQELARMDCAHLALHDIRSLSRGERQRVAIATALAQDTPLLLLDEPTAHQDPKHQAWVLAELAQQTHCGLLMTLHDVNAAAGIATHALLLAGDGRWIAGNATEVLTTTALSDVFGATFNSTEQQGRRLFFLAAANFAGGRATSQNTAYDLTANTSLDGMSHHDHSSSSTILSGPSFSDTSSDGTNPNGARHS